MNKKETAQNGKGDAPRNNFSQAYRANYDAILWKSKTRKPRRKNQTNTLEIGGIKKNHDHCKTENQPDR